MDDSRDETMAQNDVILESPTEHVSGFGRSKQKSETPK